MRLTISSGSLSGHTNKLTPTCLITATALAPYPDDYYRNGILVVLCPFRQNPADPLAGHKTTSYFSRMLALQQAHLRQAAESLWFTTDGYLSEGCVSNVFLVKDNTLLTPPIGTPVLPGVTRKTICKIAHREKLAFSEKALTIDDLLNADEILITNVIMKVMPVIAVEKHTVGQGTVGPLTTKLKDWFDQEIQQQCGVVE
jgi:branched-subunit amino acid aminotransferase/4-amino-4-deoxychorismate lyase